MQGLKILLIFYILVWGGLNAKSDPPNHTPAIFTAEDGKIFLPQKASYQSWLFMAAPNTADSISVQTADPKDAFELPEGRVEIGAITSDGKKITQIYYVDGTPPEVSLSLRGPNHISDGERLIAPKTELVFRAVDNLSGVNQIYISVNESDFGAHNKAHELTAEEGQYQLRYYATDNVGNASEVKEFSFIRDNTPPMLAHNISGDSYNQNHSGRSRFELSAEDEHSGNKEIRYKIKGYNESFHEYIGPVSLADLEQAEYTFLAVAEDLVNNISDTLKYEFRVDNSPPLVNAEVTEPFYIHNENKFISTQTQIQINAHDEHSSVREIRYNIDGGEFLTYTEPFNIDGESGIYTIRYMATDNLNNTSVAQSLRVYLDQNPPEKDYLFVGPYSLKEEIYVVSTQTKLILEAEDFETEFVHIEFAYTTTEQAESESLAWQDYEDELTFAETGTKYVYFRARDGVDNKTAPEVVKVEVSETDIFAFAGTEAPQPVKTDMKFYIEDEKVIVPQTEPVFLFISDSPEADGQQFLLAGNTNDVDVKGFRLSGEGQATIKFDVEDLVQIFEVTGDGSPPKTRYTKSNTPKTTVNDTLVFNNEINFSLSAADNISGVEHIFYSVDGAAFHQYNSTIGGFTSEKPYSLRFYATDMVGNTEPVNEVFFRIDNTPPRSRIELLSDFTGTILSPHTTFGINTSDNLAGVAQTFFRFNDSETWYKYNGAITLGDYADYLTSGETQSIHYYSVDHVSNREADRTFYFRYQDVRPALAYEWKGKVLHRDDVYYIHPEAKLVLIPSTGNVPLREMRYSLNGQQKTYTEEIQFPPGSSESIRMIIEDEIGNKSEPKSIVYVSDASLPTTRHEIAGNFITDGGIRVYGPGSSLKLHADDNNSGVSQTRFSINDRPAQRYREPIALNRSQHYDITYFSVDNLGNAEESNRVTFRVDVTPPEIELTVAGHVQKSLPDATEVISSNTLILINAVDKETEVQSITYQINDGPLQTPFGPIRDLPENKRIELRVTATDLLGNTSVLNRTFQIE